MLAIRAAVDSPTRPTLVGPFFRKVGVSIGAFDCFSKRYRCKCGSFAGSFGFYMASSSSSNCEDSDKDFVENIPEILH